MRISTSAFISLALVALPAFAAPSPLRTIEKFMGKTTGRYIVKLKEGISKKAVMDRLPIEVSHDWKILNGFAGKSPRLPWYIATV